MTTFEKTLPSTNKHGPKEAGGPSWLREFASTLAVHAQFVFHGNVHDQFLTADGAGLTSLPALLWGVLRDLGFACLVTYDQVEGIGVHPRFGDGAAGARLMAGKLVGSTEREVTLAALQRYIAAVVEAPTDRCAFVLGHASRLTLRADDLTADERDFFLFCAKLGSSALYRAGTGAPYNPLIWLVEREGDLPTWFTQGNAHVRSIAVPPPDLGTRQRAARLLAGADATAAVVDRFAVESHGLTLKAMAGVTQLARDRGIPADQLPEAVATYRLGVVENPWRQDHLRTRLSKHQGELAAKVKGQAQAVEKTLDVLKRAAMGLSGAHTGQPSSRPRGVLFFAGPTGVGKTELAKSIAKLVYGDAGALLRLDMSEFSASHAADRLIGAPPGYTGHAEGGQLTNAMRRQPFSVVLFDEIEKAHPQVLDKFLQVLEDGRLTDGRGDTAYFSESILIFTSNLGVLRKDKRTDIVDTLVTPEQEFPEIDTAVRDAIAEHFRGIQRPELLNRIGDNIAVFDFIRPHIARSIFDGQVANVVALVAREHGIEVELPSWITERLAAECTKDLAFGGRGIGNQVEALLVNPLARALFDAPVPPGTHITVDGLDLSRTPPKLEFIRGD